ncbi:PREDICTED: cytochrome b5-like isoform X2 [Priapulus caudatus]|uniref:Cytochrome b5 n=1 Tax=Priapulus caudatus TaxID=37621 RepID=A0ABM1E1I5_PRICU|nr:PREDICTED: cytochrome b5-like isoform X2 [Priapulus caudatus]
MADSGQAKAQEEPVKYYALKEVEEHNNEKSLWVVIHNKVYDVTMFLASHPGGEAVMLEQAGKIASEPFDDVGHSSDAKALKEEHYIGELATADRVANDKEKTPNYNETPEAKQSWCQLL